MSETSSTTPALGPDRGRCPGCGAPLADDQRYCVACGARRPGTRLPFREVLAERAAPLSTTRPRRDAFAAAPDPAPDRLRRDAAFLGGLACLLLALGIGVLIGRSGDRTPSRAAAPQVITVTGGAAAAPAATTAATAPTGAATAGAAGTTSAKAARRKARAKGTPAAAKSKATNKALKNLGGTSGADYQKKSQKLPKTLGTGGKAPPVDKSKPVGAGSGVQEIG